MNFEVIKTNLFSLDKSYTLMQCISSDCAMGKGIAVQFNIYFNMKNQLLPHRSYIQQSFTKNGATAIQSGRVINLVTKATWRDKPTYESLRKSLEIAKKGIRKKNIKKIAIPAIGCGLDRLNLDEVIEIVKDVFKDTDLEIKMCLIN